MFSEEQAKAKWCPFIREILSIPDVVASAKPSRCRASDCMAWRWVLTKKPLPHDYQRAAGTAAGLAYALQPTTYELGYYGAVGKPTGWPPSTPESIAPSNEEENAA